MKLTATVLRQLVPEAVVAPEIEVTTSRIRADSRAIKPGDVFAAMPGNCVDGHTFVHQAASAGASAVIVDRHMAELQIPQIVVPSVPVAYARFCLAGELRGNTPPTLAGVTGTNGKTTTTWMVHSILKAASLRSGCMGTLEVCDGTSRLAASMTTPPADEIARWIGSLAANGCSHGVLEVSSHALDQERCAALRFSAAAVTNVTQDHLDYHHSPDSYRFAKSRIAELMHADAPVLLNMADEGCRILAAELGNRASVVTYGVDVPDAELTATVLATNHRSQRVRLFLAQGDADVKLRLIGGHNVANSLAAAGLAEQMGLSIRDIVTGLESLQSVPGRLERLDQGQPFQVIVDYAHTPDALSHTISAIRGFAPGRLICVFGAGGNRDRSKRQAMGTVASECDVSIVTSDNPRDESPARIIEQIASGFPSRCGFCPVEDREQAIRQALEEAEPGDVVLIAGKGHESTQEIAGRKYPFDDRAVATRILKELSTPIASDLHPDFSMPKSA